MIVDINILFFGLASQPPKFFQLLPVEIIQLATTLTTCHLNIFLSTNIGEGWSNVPLYNKLLDHGKRDIYIYIYIYIYIIIYRYFIFTNANRNRLAIRTPLMVIFTLPLFQLYPGLLHSNTVVISTIITIAAIILSEYQLKSASNLYSITNRL